MKKLVRYLCVGGISALSYFTVFAACFRVVGLGYMLAMSIGYIFSVFIHFCGNRYFTFQLGKRSAFTELAPKYGTVLLLNYGISYLLMNMMVTRHGYSPYMGVVLSIGATVTSGFLLSKYWVFVDRGKDRCVV